MSQQSRQQVASAVKAMESKKAEDIAILEMDRSSGAFTDYFIVCSGTNPRQIQAIADEVQKQLWEFGLKPNSVEGYNQAEWVLLDYVDMVVHVFSERARKFYDLDRLWKSARHLRPGDLLKKPAAVKGAKKEAVGAKSKRGVRHERAGKSRRKAARRARNPKK